MGTGTIPFGNTAGVNQTSPNTGGAVPIAMPGAPTGPVGTLPGAVPQVLGTTQTGTYTSNGSTTSPGAVQSPNLITTAQDGGQNALTKQLTDIYGQGVGNELMTLLGGIGGTNSAEFQQYVASLQPQIAAGQASLNANLGASGASANSSVAAIADSNYQSGVLATESGADAQIMSQGLQDEIGIVTGTEGAAEQEVAQSGWNTFGQVLEGIGGVAAKAIGVGGIPGGGGVSGLFSGGSTTGFDTQNSVGDEQI